MGTKEAIKIVGNRFDLLKEYSQTRTPHAEKFLHNTIISNGIKMTLLFMGIELELTVLLKLINKLYIKQLTIIYLYMNISKKLLR